MVRSVVRLSDKDSCSTVTLRIESRKKLSSVLKEAGFALLTMSAITHSTQDLSLKIHMMQSGVR